MLESSNKSIKPYKLEGTSSGNNSELLRNHRRHSTTFNTEQKKNLYLKTVGNDENKTNCVVNPEEFLPKNARLTRELNRANDIIKAKDQDISNYIKKINELTIKLQIAEQQHTKDDAINLLEDEIIKLKAKNNLLENQLIELVQKIANMENEKDSQVKKGLGISPVNEFKNSSRERIFPSFIDNQKNEFTESRLAKLQQKTDLEKLKLEEDIEFLKEKFEKLQIAYNNMKQQYDDLINRFKDDENDKGKCIAQAKKLEDQLKNANNNLVLMYKKCDNLEKENKEMLENIKNLEQEKKNYLDKWSKLSSKTKLEDKLKLQIKVLESDLNMKNQEIEGLRQKYVNANTELYVLKETEKTYKDLIENKNISIKELQNLLENYDKQREELLKKNEELNEHKFDYNKVIDNTEDENDDIGKNKQRSGNKNESMLIKSKKENKENMELKNKKHIKNMTLTINRLEKEKVEYIKNNEDMIIRLNNYDKKFIELGNLKDKLQAELIRCNKRYELLKGDFENLYQEYMVLFNEKQNENELLEVLQKKNLEDKEEINKPKLLVNNGDDLIKDENYMRIIEFIDNNQDILTCFHKHIQAIKDTYCNSNSDIQIKYDRLLVKYYKFTEKFKELERNLSQNTSANNSLILTNSNENTKNTLYQQNTKFSKQISPDSDKQGLTFTPQKNENPNKVYDLSVNQSPSSKKKDFSYALKPAEVKKKTPERRSNNSADISNGLNQLNDLLKGKLNVLNNLVNDKVVNTVPNSGKKIQFLPGSPSCKINASLVPKNILKDLMKIKVIVNEESANTTVSRSNSYEKNLKRPDSNDTYSFQTEQLTPGLLSMTNDQKSFLAESSSKNRLKTIIHVANNLDSNKKGVDNRQFNSGVKPVNRTYSEIHHSRKSSLNNASFHISK